MAKYLDKSGVEKLWSKTKGLVETSVEGISDKIGANNGLATLDQNGKLPSTQLTELKTINGESIVGSGNITLDLNIYKLVDALPEVATADTTKIYLVLSGTAGTQNKYTEYAVVNGAWEKFGEYQAEVDLTPYLKKEDIAEEVKDAGFVTFDDTVKSDKNGLVPSSNYNHLNQLFKAVTTGVLISSYFTKNTQSELVLQIQKYSYSNLTGTTSFDVTIPCASTSKAGIITATQYNKLETVAENATADSAISDTDLDSILV